MRNKPIDLKYKSPDWFLYHKVHAMKLKKIFALHSLSWFSLCMYFSNKYWKRENYPYLPGRCFSGWKKAPLNCFFVVFFHLVASLSTKIQCIINWTSNFEQQNKLVFQTKCNHLFPKKELKTEEKVNLGTYWRFWVQRFLISINVFFIGEY